MYILIVKNKITEHYLNVNEKYNTKMIAKELMKLDFFFPIANGCGIWADPARDQIQDSVSPEIWVIFFTLCMFQI